MIGGTEINWAGQVKNFAITGDEGPPLLIFREGDSLKEGSFLSIGIKKKKRLCQWTKTTTSSPYNYY